MRKLVLMVVVMAIAAPAMADMVLTGTDNGNGTMTVSYITDVAPRGVAFRITATGADITGSSAQLAAFNANIDWLYSNPGQGVGQGHGLAKDGGPGTFVSGNVAVISAGVLDESGGQAAGPLDDGSGGPIALITIVFSGACTVDIEVDTLRSATGAVGSTIVVDYTAVTGFVVTSAPSGPLTDTTAILPQTFYENGGPGRPDDRRGENYYAEWVLMGEPSCWAYPSNCHGDADGREQGNVFGYFKVSTDDINVMLAAWETKEDKGMSPGPGILGEFYVPQDPTLTPVELICSDFNHAEQGNVFGYFRVSTDDINIMLDHWEIKEDKGMSPGPGIPVDCGGTLDPPPLN